MESKQALVPVYNEKLKLITHLICLYGENKYSSLNFQMIGLSITTTFLRWLRLDVLQNLTFYFPSVFN